MKHPLRIPVLLAAVALLAAACSSSADDTTTTTAYEALSTTTTAATSTTAATTTTTSTTTTTLAPGVEPTINGLPAEEDLYERRVIGVKIDNHPSARPQSGLQDADAVYEVLVEGGLTRFIALFHQSDSEFVGPNRSGRPTDAALMAPLGGAFQISGAQSWVRDIFKKSGVHVVYDNGITTFRMPHRKAPHNLYTSTPEIRDYADDQGWADEAPPPLFVYGNEPTPTTETAETITFDWSNHPVVVWEWDGEQYLRFNKSTPHEWVDADSQSGQVSFDMLVVLKGDQYIASSASGAGSSVPAVHTTGSGEALVFHSGGVFEATWEREDVQDVMRVVDAEGNDVILPPGRVWINVFPDHRTLTWE
ncbi:MAG: hypothetical protein DRJ50_06035 [Actinobacteria bacterium]|nr:MAG: hypothetical protein DRJ50_06035 [Actinomycetota bacterium]